MKVRRDFKQNAEITLAAALKGDVPETLTLSEKDFCIGNNRVTDAAGSNSLPVGVAVGRTIQMEIMNNGDDLWTQHDYFGAKVRLYLTFEDVASGTERIELGTFTVVEAETYGNTVTVSACDDMYKADKPYTTTATFPCRIDVMLEDACRSCGIQLHSSQFRNCDFEVVEAPSTDLTFRQVIGYIAMLAGGNARIDRQGYLCILEYDFDTMAKGNNSQRHELDGWKSLKTDTSDIAITGVQVTAGGETYLCGESGYVIAVENPLIAGKEEAAADLLGAVFVGMAFRKFDGEHVADPTIEFMDAVKITDRKGQVCYSVVTDVEFAFFGFTELSNSAESALRSGKVYQSPLTVAIQESRKLVERERTSREAAIEQMQKTLGESSGMYVTEKPQSDGSVIRYMHDKPTKEESKNIVKITADAICFSADGDEDSNYLTGISFDGNAILNRLDVNAIAAKLIAADVITTERISVNGGSLADYFDVSMDAENHPVVRIGSSGSAIVLRLENDKIAFYDPKQKSEQNPHGSLLAYWTNNSFEIVNLQRFRLGPMSLVVQPNNSISFVGVV